MKENDAPPEILCNGEVCVQTSYAIFAEDGTRCASPRERGKGSSKRPSAARWSYPRVPIDSEGTVALGSAAHKRPKIRNIVPKLCESAAAISAPEMEFSAKSFP
jgi:hypothetical protein